MASDYLFNIPTTLSGVARAIDLSGRFSDYNTSLTACEADQRAMLADAMTVARDIAEAAQVVSVTK